MKPLILIAALVGLSACGAQTSARSALTPAREAADDVITEADIPDVPASPSSDECDWVNVEETSSLVPNDWDDWCEGFSQAVSIFAGYSGSELSQLCDDFWLSDDEDLLATMRYDYDLGRDQAIGAIDSLWILCS